MLMLDLNINVDNPGNTEDDLITSLQCMQFQQLVDI